MIRSFKNHVAAGAIVALSGFAMTANAETVLQLASVETPATIWGQVAQRFADGVEEASGGDLRIELALSGSTGSVRETLEALFDALIHSTGLSPDEARTRLSRTRPFDRHPDLVAALGDN